MQEEGAQPRKVRGPRVVSSSQNRSLTADWFEKFLDMEDELGQKAISSDPMRSISLGPVRGTTNSSWRDGPVVAQGTVSPARESKCSTFSRNYSHYHLEEMDKLRQILIQLKELKMSFDPAQELYVYQAREPSLRSYASTWL